MNDTAARLLLTLAGTALAFVIYWLSPPRTHPVWNRFFNRP